MPDNKASLLAHEYVCPKCRGKNPHVREVALSKTPLIRCFALRIPFFPSPRDNRYLEVTCTLCGYTEFYNLAVYASARENAEETQAAKIASAKQA